MSEHEYGMVELTLENALIVKDRDKFEEWLESVTYYREEPSKSSFKGGARVFWSKLQELASNAV